MKIVACSQARLDSTRLPGKVLLQVGGKSLLDYHISRVAQATKLVEHVIATSENENDNKIVAFCEQRGVRVIRGIGLYWSLIPPIAAVTVNVGLGNHPIVPQHHQHE